MNGGVCLSRAHEVAVVGLGARFPGADTVGEFWKLLIEGRDAITEVPLDRFDITAVHDPRPAAPGRTVSRHGGFLSDAYAFDASFFGIAPVEARVMDPQQRLLLQVTWEALESAGIRPSTLAGTRVGVFVGVATAEYGETLGDPSGIREAAGARLRAVTAGRLSYAFDLRGPSMTVDTACSSSLVAVHLARQSLVAGECDLAIAAGANFIHSPTDAIVYSQAGMLSPSGRCRFGDAEAEGFVRSEGIGAVVLERTADAHAAGDPILATVRASVVNNDGRGSGLLLQPAAVGQAAMIREACELAGIDPLDLDYVEAHGTGTTVGDAAELRALGEIVAARNPDRPLPIGSVKTNIGHAEAAAGIAGLIKAVLVARHRIVPASLHFTRANSVLDEYPLRVVDSTRQLDTNREHPVVGVSSFGISGTNAHVIVEGGGQVVGSGRATGRPALLVLSAASPGALREMVTRYAAYLEGVGRERPLEMICANLARRRDHHRYRAWAVGSDHDDLARTLRELSLGAPIRRGGIGEIRSRPVRSIFLYSGQGSQWDGMARELSADEPVFAAALSQCDELVRAEFGWSIVEHLEGARTPTRTGEIQPSIWAVQIALTALLRSWGVEPDECIGHSMGEVAAATVSGALTIRDAAKVIGVRSGLLDRIAGAGGMLVTGLCLEDATEIIADYAPLVEVAASNSPTSTVLAGEHRALAAIATRLEQVGVPARAVDVDVASHCAQTAVLLDDLRDRLADLRPTVPDIPLRSTVTTERISGAELNARYWADNLRLPVRLCAALGRTVAEDDCAVLEIAPHPLLTGAVREIQKEQGREPAAVAAAARHSEARVAASAALGQMYAHGVEIGWERYFPVCEPIDDLPTYAWDREIHRHSPSRGDDGRAFVSETAIPADVLTARVGGIRSVPPVTYLTAILDTARSQRPDLAVTLSTVRLHAAAGVADPNAARLSVALRAGHGTSRHASVTMSDDGVGPATPVATAVVTPAATPPDEIASIDDALARCDRYMSAEEFHAALASRGVLVDAASRANLRIWHSRSRAVACVRPDTSQSPAATLETCLRVLPILLPPDALYQPATFDTVEIESCLDAAPLPLWSIATIDEPLEAGATGTVTVLSAVGEVLARFDRITLVATAFEHAPMPPPSVHDRPTPSRDLLVEIVARVLGTSVDRVDVGRSLIAHGMDSLMAIEVSSRLRRRLGGAVPSPSTLLAAERIDDIARSLENPRSPDEYTG